MKQDAFEKTLRKIRARRVPAEWKDDILAKAHSRRMASSDAIGGCVFERFNGWMHSLLWPHPRAWGTLAALWLVAFVLGNSGPSMADLSTSSKLLPPFSGAELIAQYQAIQRRNAWVAALSRSYPSYQTIDRSKL